MYIEEVVVDGFKSYAHRTVIKGFDPHFNAITGLNGSGKSNILDSICFVLGITNLSQVRAGNLSELVYKQGQAGVNKAIVTIVFNNEDESCSPVGYEQCKEVTVTRQVLLGGKSKYLINGRNAPAGQVQNLFHSVQLNVNNPHFLIMQGRITKVLNMKPHEILGMVEEAAGTRMYETKRVAALKTIDKKQAKVDELNSVLSEEITPTLERLRGEKQNYLKWSKNRGDIERIERFVVASEFMDAKNALEDDSEGSEDMKDKVVELQQTRTQLEEEIVSIESEVEKLAAKLKGEFEKEHVSAKGEEDTLSKELVKATSTWKNSKDSVKKAEKDLEAAQSLVEETREGITSKERERGEEADAIKKQQQDATDASEQLAQLQTDYKNMSAGISSSQGDEGRTLPERISQALSDSKTAEAKAKRAAMRIKKFTAELKLVNANLKKQETQNGTIAKAQEEAKKEVEGFKQQIQELGFSTDEFNQMEKQKNQLEDKISELSGKIDRISHRLKGRLCFDYKDPARGFDRSKVKGRVAKLVTMTNPQHATALEIVAGGKLYNIVVDDSITSKGLLEKGQMQKRVTIIPLDKIRGRQLPDTVTRTSSQIANDRNTMASPAIELVGFNEEVRTAMEYVFGSSIVVGGPDAANEICNRTKTRTVTLEGDMYDPKGTISGGSKPQSGSILEQLAELALAEKERSEKQGAHETLSAKIESLRGKSVAYDNVSAALEFKQAELEQIQKQLSETSFGLLLNEKEKTLKELKEAQEDGDANEKKMVHQRNLHEELKNKEAELTQEREDKLKQILESIAATKNEVVEKQKIAREADSKSQTSTLELEDLKTELLAAQEAVRAAEKLLKDAKSEASDLEIAVGDVKARYDVSKEKLQGAEKRRATCSKELSDLEKQKTIKGQEHQVAAVEIKKLEIAIKKLEKDRATAERVVANMLKKYSWIESEQSAFGVAGGDYDFEAMDPKENSRQLKELKSEQDSLSKKINKKVMGMIEKAEGEYTELLRKRKVVENDKKKIQAVIEELDVKKKSELQRTWIKVNRDFGSIFSTLLPGASAKLEPPEGMEAWEGLEVKVAFGNVWKESLSELSGGQRSLLALSLILSLLLFKPAPMYILDEVDAALDLSHTQNIGNMLKTHFSQSQFIVVSLKEGMFNNANVIFRTKFVDGVSTVTHSLGSSGKTSKPSSKANGLSGSQGKSKTSRRGARSSGKENTYV